MTRWKEQWTRFAAQAPGSRFRDRHDRHQANRHLHAWWRRPLNIAIGIGCLAVGLVLTVAPGPAVVFFVVAGFVLANESRSAARALDWMDVRIAPAVHFVQQRWARLSPRVRRAATVCMVLGSVVSVVAGVFVLR